MNTEKQSQAKVNTQNHNILHCIVFLMFEEELNKEKTKEVDDDSSVVGMSFDSNM
jgi:hypothetical protein